MKWEDGRDEKDHKPLRNPTGLCYHHRLLYQENIGYTYR